MPIGAAQKLIIAFATLIIGIGLLTTVSTEEQAKTQLTTKLNESIDLSGWKIGSGTASYVNQSKTYTLTNAPTGWKTQDSDCNIALLEYTNASATFTVDTDFNITTAGLVGFKNTSIMRLTANSTFIDYNYCSDDYLAENWSRTTLNVVPGLFALALLLISVALFYSLAKEYDIF